MPRGGGGWGFWAKRAHAWGKSPKSANVHRGVGDTEPKSAHAWSPPSPPPPFEQKEGQKLWKHYTRHLRYTHARGNKKAIWISIAYHAQLMSLWRSGGRGHFWTLDRNDENITFAILRMCAVNITAHIVTGTTRIYIPSDPQHIDSNLNYPGVDITLDHSAPNLAYSCVKVIEKTCQNLLAYISNPINCKDIIIFIDLASILRRLFLSKKDHKWTCISEDQLDICETHEKI